MSKTTTGSRLAENPAVWAALCGVILFARFPDWIIRPRLWAEDGDIFFLHASRNWFADVFDPYAGYFHLLPRTVAWLGYKLDPALIPGFYVYSALAVTLGVAALLFSSRFQLPCKPLLAIAIVGAPGTGEVFLTPTNLQWIASLSLVITLLMRDPEGIAEWALDIVVLAAVGLTGPFSLFVAPFFLLRALSRKTRASWTLAGVVLATALTQGWQIVFHPAPSGFPHGPFDLLEFIAVLSSHIFLAFADAQAWVHMSGRTAVDLLGCVGFVLIFSCLLIKDGFRKERLTLLLFTAVLVGFTTSRARFDLWDYREVVNAERYFYIPRVLVAWVAVSCLGRTAGLRLYAGISMAAIALVATWYTPYTDGPAYSARHVERAYFDWSPYVERLRRGEAVEIQWSPGWKCVVPARAGQGNP